MKGIYSYPTVILRHARENLKKCSLRGLEGRGDFLFFTYPRDTLPDLSGYLLLRVDAPSLSPADCNRGLFLLDATWRLAEKMGKSLPPNLEVRSLPSHFRTAYPREQTDCPDPERGLASIEALFLSYYLMGRSTEGLLDNYYWRTLFLEKNCLV
ncbi:MAG: hypothetical protein KGI80_05315 [Verrucomicrobiota bacterium]|nr:hypothetical protein [Verrucomicrobiota bacterium]